MKKITSKKLLKYGALSAAIAGIADANGQIVYTDIADFTGGGAVDYNLDLNNDTTPDFIINAISSNASIFAVFLNSNSSNSFLGSQPNYTYPFAMNAGDPISSGQAGWYNNGTLNYVSCLYGAGSSNWCGVTDKFLGLRFDVGGNTHYGWARLDVSASGDSFTIKDYAYNSTPGAPINAGQTLSTNEFENNNTRIVALNKSIALYNLPQSIEYKVVDITGKSVMSGNLVASDSYVIEANTLANGVYIVELFDANSNAIIRKKVVL